MKRLVMIGVACLAMGACSKAPDGGEVAGSTASGAAGVAFAYRYDFRLPSAQIADAQEAHAQACEALVGRCRITGMTYRLDSAGEVDASLSVAVAAPLARGFGRRSTQAVERAGGLLAGAEITGSDTAPTIAAATRGAAEAADDVAALDRRLAARDLDAATRADLRTRRDALVAAAREQAGQRAAAEASVATTPMTFAYAAGHGNGIAARLEEAWRTLLGSATWTLVAALTLLAYAGPPALALLLLALLWHRVGRRWWVRAFPDRQG